MELGLPPASLCVPFFYFSTSLYYRAKEHLNGVRIDKDLYNAIT